MQPIHVSSRSIRVAYIGSEVETDERRLYGGSGGNCGNRGDQWAGENEQGGCLPAK